MFVGLVEDEVYVKHALMIAGKEVDHGGLVDLQFSFEVLESIFQIESSFVSPDPYFVDGSVIFEVNKLGIVWCLLSMVE